MDKYNIYGNVPSYIRKLYKKLFNKNSELIDVLSKLVTECIECNEQNISGRFKAIEIGKIYTQLSKSEKEKFLEMLIDDFDVDENEIVINIQKYNVSTKNKHTARVNVINSMLARRLKLIKRFSALSDGIKFLVDMRGDVLDILRYNKKLSPLNDDLCHVLNYWFDFGLLDIKKITWKSSASLLEKLIKYEAVHKIKSWDDMKNRLDSDRCCFALFHHKMPDEPLVFVEVALSNHYTKDLNLLLDKDAPVIDINEVNTAIFYSISNTQKGLRGISFGNFLIKNVVQLLMSEYQNIKTFVTLSPIPGFSKWIEGNKEIVEKKITQKEKKSILFFSKEHENIVDTLSRILNTDNWWNGAVSDTVKSVMLRLCAFYLISIENLKAIDPVAHFHLTNGAYIDSINWLSDTSNTGLKRSFGMMVSYKYDLLKIDSNHDSYTAKSEIIYSKNIKDLL